MMNEYNNIIPLWRLCVSSLTAAILTISSVLAMDRRAESEDLRHFTFRRNGIYREHQPYMHLSQACHALIEVNPVNFETLTHNQKAHWLKQLDFKSLTIPQQYAWLEVLMAQEDHLNLILKGCEVLTNQHFLINKPQKGTFLWCISRNSLNPGVHPSLRINNLRNVDLTGCQNITDALIPLFATEAVVLKSLTLRNLPKLFKLQGPLFFPVLEWLDIGGCFNLNKVHLKAPCLWMLIADDCPRVSSLKLITPLLKELDVRGMKRLTDKRLERLLECGLDIKTLRLEGCDQVLHQNIRQECPQILLAGASKRLVDSIVALLTNNVTDINLERKWFVNQIDDAGARALAYALSQNTSLITLNLYGNQIGDAGARALAYALSQDVPFTTPDLRRNEIGAAGAHVLEQALFHNAILIAIILSYNHIGNASLTRLYLGENRICAAGAQALAYALSQNTSLTILNLEQNKFGDTGAEALARALSQNTSLTILDLRNTFIYDDASGPLYVFLKNGRVLLSSAPDD